MSSIIAKIHKFRTKVVPEGSAVMYQSIPAVNIPPGPTPGEGPHPHPPQAKKAAKPGPRGKNSRAKKL